MKCDFVVLVSIFFQPLAGAAWLCDFLGLMVRSLFFRSVEDWEMAVKYVRNVAFMCERTFWFLQRFSS